MFSKRLALMVAELRGGDYVQGLAAMLLHIETALLS